MTGPVAVGGVGGSGTRLVAQLLARAGCHLGSDLNAAHDNLWFTLLFRRPAVPAWSNAEFAAWTDVFVSAMTSRRLLTREECRRIEAVARQGDPHLPTEWLEQRAQSLIAAGTRGGPPPRRPWGWKEPNTHIVLPWLRLAVPGLRYVHVVRHGLDMAFSPNKNQVRLWGEWLLGSDGEVTPKRSLAYWCAVHRRILDVRASMPADFFWLDYDDLCAHPEQGLASLATFLDLPDRVLAHWRELVRPPASIGRHRQHPLDQFEPADVAYVRSLGFAVD